MYAFIDSCAINASVRYSGIYHKLKIICPHKRMTFAHYLEMLQNEEIEDNSTSIFSRLCNSKHFWIKPWNDLNYMTLIYGPAIWFLTLALVSRHGMIRVNINVKLTLTWNIINKQTGCSWSSFWSRFMEIKHKTFVDFIMSEDNPIGKVAHYYY